MNFSRRIVWVTLSNFASANVFGMLISVSILFYKILTGIVYAILAAILFYSSLNQSAAAVNFFLGSFIISVLIFLFRNALQTGLLKKIIYFSTFLEFLLLFIMFAKNSTEATFNEHIMSLLFMPAIVGSTILFYRTYTPVKKKLSSEEKMKSRRYKFILGVFLLLFIGYIIYVAIALSPLYLK